MSDVSTKMHLNVDKPLYDLNTFCGRFKHFAWMTDPRTVFVSTQKLEAAKKLLADYRAGKAPKNVTNDELKYAMKLYASAFHPDTGELQNLAGRMSFQVPGGMLITGGMLAFYSTIRAVVLWQFINQSFNAVVNYTNRNANAPTNKTQLLVAYCSATTSALVAAIGCKQYWSKNSPPIFQRFVPFAAVAAANCVNIPLMRQNEIINGVEVKDEHNKVVGTSRVAAVKGISQVVVSRIFMAAPGMLLLPFIMQRVEQLSIYKKLKWANAPFQTVLVGSILLIMVPTACALFPQTCSLKTSTIKTFEKERYEEMLKTTKNDVPNKVFFNKGL